MASALLPIAAALAACTPSSQESAMHNSSPAPGTAASGSGDADGAAAGPAADTPAEAQGRRTLSTAFVRVGPDGLLTVELRDGRVLLLRNAVLRPRDFCGTQVSGGKAGAQYCGEYAEVAAARPGGVRAPE